MAELDSIKEVVNHAAMQAATAVMMALRDAKAGSWPTTAVSHREPQKQRHSGTVLVN